MEILFFATQAEWRKWLAENHDKTKEVWVGYYKKGTGKPSITWPESVDEALCFGWIDGIRKSVDEDSYKIRFTPRKPRSIWSAVNVKRVGELIELGLMQPSGLKTFENRDQEKTNRYSYEAANADHALDAAYGEQFKQNKKAWEYFQAQAPSYQRAASWWVMSAKQEATRLKRLARLIDDSENGQRIEALTPPNKRKK